MKKMCAALCALSLSACATSPYVGVPYTAPAEPVTSVGILDDSLDDDAGASEAASALGNVGGAMAGFGLIGLGASLITGAIDAVDQNNRKKKINEALDTVEYDAEANFEKFMVEEFAEVGVSGVVIEGPDREKREFLEEYPTAPSGVQALLDTKVLYYGYSNPGSTSWRPTIYADVRLVSAENGEILMENRIAYNPLGEEQGIITIPPDPNYSFENRDEMADNPELLAEGLDVALRELAKTVVRLMQ